MDDERRAGWIDGVKNVPGRNDVVAFELVPVESSDLGLVQDHDIGFRDFLRPGALVCQVSFDCVHVRLVAAKDIEVVRVLVDADNCLAAGLMQAQGEVLAHEACNPGNQDALVL